MNSSIQQEVERWMRVYENNKATESLQGSIYDVLGQFHDFIGEYIGFLLENTSKAPDIFPTDWLSLSIEAVLVEYWEPIKRVAQQYRTEKYFLENFPEDYNAKVNLLDTGYRELVAYNENFPKQIKMPQKMLIYFDKIEKAIRYPFGPVLLVGIPYQDARRNDWSAIPHEIGHHLYWNLLFNFDNKRKVPYRDEPTIFGGMVDRVFQKDAVAQKTLKAWSEEIFAETVGALIGKEKHIESAFKKVLARVGVDEELFSHDNDHPAPYFIPFIRAFAWGGKLDDAIDALWERYGKDRFKKMNEITDDSKEPQKVKTNVIINGLKKFVDNIVSFFTEGEEVSDGQPESLELSKQYVLPLTNEIAGEEFSIHNLVAWIKKEGNVKNDEELIRKLLIPRILEGHKWQCRFCGKINENDQAQSCAFCSRKR